VHQQVRQEWNAAARGDVKSSARIGVATFDETNISWLPHRISSVDRR
jgi:hypothetical protein